jgi:hypothetical protein
MRGTPDRRPIAYLQVYLTPLAASILRMTLQSFW